MSFTPNSAVTDVKLTPNISSGRPYGAPNVIVIHHWGVDGQSHQNVVNYLCNPNNHGASAHYVVSGGRVTQLASDWDRTWHAGPNGNSRGIGIECRPECTPGDFNTVIDLVKAIRSEHGNLPVMGHRDYMSTACPGRYYSRLGEISAGTGTVNKPPKILSHAAETGYGYITVDGHEDQETWSRLRRVMDQWYPAPWKTVITQLQFFLSDAVDYRQQKDLIGGVIVKDGIEGPKTIKLLQWWMWHQGPNASSNPPTKVWQKFAPGYDIWDFVTGEKHRASNAVFQETLNYSVANAKALGTWKP